MKSKLYFSILVIFIFSFSMTFALTTQSRSRIYPISFTPNLSANEITIFTPENKTYTQPMSGYYPGTYGFENEENGELGAEVAFITRYDSDHSEAYARIENNVNGHNNVLKFYDAVTSNNYNFYAYHDFATKIPYGTIEFWVLNKEYSGDQTGIYYHFSNSSGAVYVSRETFNSLFYLTIDQDNNGLVTIQTGSGERSWSNLYSDDTWHHVRIDFESTTGGYLGLGQYELSFWFDGIQRLNHDHLIINDSLGIIASHSHGWDNTRHDYLDAVGFSWDPNYDIGDNRDEGLLLSFDNDTTLDWIGYSLDGQTNKTIMGNTTIRLQTNGLHSIQIFGSNSSDINFQSEIRYYTLDISQPVISILVPLAEQFFGVSAPTFSFSIQGVYLDEMWYTIDGGVINITVYSNLGSVNQLAWDNKSHGSVYLTFYANDSFGRIGYDTTVIYKDLNPPTTSLDFTADNPPNQITGSTQFTLTATDDGSSVSTIEYKINDGSWTVYTGSFSLSGFDPGIYTISYRSVDLVGNIEAEQFLNVELVPTPLDLSFLIYIIIIGAIIITIGILYIKVIRPRSAESRELKKKNRLEQKRLKREQLEKLAFEKVKLERERLEQIRRERDLEIQKQVRTVPMESFERKREKFMSFKFCPECGSPIKPEDLSFCSNCGIKIKHVKPSVNTSEFLGGIIISLIGGSISILLGFGLPFIYPEIANSVATVFLILQIAMIIGGIVSIIGAFLVFYKPRLGSSIVVVGSLISGINIITVAGAGRILKKLRATGRIPQKKKKMPKGIGNEVFCPFCHSEVKPGQEFCEYCGNRID